MMAISIAHKQINMSKFFRGFKMKLIKTALFTASIFAAGATFAESASINAGANVQANSNGVLNQIGNGVKNGVTHATQATQHAAHATSNAGSHVMQGTQNVAHAAKDKTVNAAQKVGQKGEHAWQTTKNTTQHAVTKTKALTAEQKAKADARVAKMQNENRSLNTTTSGNVKVGSVQANSGLNTQVSRQGVNVQSHGHVNHQPQSSAQ